MVKFRYMEIKPSHQKICQVCKAPFVVPPEIGKAIAERRKYCSLKCSSLGRWARFREKGYIPPHSSPKPLPNGEQRTRPLRLERAVARYMMNPSICKECKNPIVPKPGQQPGRLRDQRFCSINCLNAAQNKFWSGTDPDNDFYNFDKLDDRVKMNTTPFLTKGESRKHRMTMINKHARLVYMSRFKENTCEFCGVTPRSVIDIAHIKAVASFPDTATLCEISQLSNVIGLCGTCHRDFDRGFVKEEEIKEKVAVRRPRP